MERGGNGLSNEPLPIKKYQGETEKMNQQLFPPVKIRKRKVSGRAKKVARHLASEVMCDFSSHTSSLSYFGCVRTKFGLGFAFANQKRLSEDEFAHANQKKKFVRLEQCAPSEQKFAP
jgi:hypothetical protein